MSPGGPKILVLTTQTCSLRSRYAFLSILWRTEKSRFLPLFRRRFVRFCVENGPKRPKSHFAGLPRPMIRYSHVTPLCGSCSARAVDTFCTIRRSPSPAGRGDPMAAKKQKFWEYGTEGSRVISDLSTNWACSCLTSQIGRDMVFSAKFGRTREAERSILKYEFQCIK